MNRSKTASSHFDLWSSRLRYSSQRSSNQRQPSADSSSWLTSSSGSSAQSGCLSTLTSSGPATYSTAAELAKPLALPCAELLRAHPPGHADPAGHVGRLDRSEE